MSLCKGVGISLIIVFSLVPQFLPAQQNTNAEQEARRQAQLRIRQQAQQAAQLRAQQQAQLQAQQAAQLRAQQQAQLQAQRAAQLRAQQQAQLKAQQDAQAKQQAVLAQQQREVQTREQAARQQQEALARQRAAKQQQEALARQPAAPTVPPTYTFTPTPYGTVQISQNGKPIATTTPQLAVQQYGYQPSSLPASTNTMQPAQPVTATTTPRLRAMDGNSQTTSSQPINNSGVSPAGASPATISSKTGQPSYTFTPTPYGTVQISQDGKLIATTTPQLAVQQYGYRIPSASTIPAQNSGNTSGALPSIRMGGPTPQTLASFEGSSGPVPKAAPALEAFGVSKGEGPKAVPVVGTRGAGKAAGPSSLLNFERFS